MHERSDDFPAFGNPTSAASASSFRCSSTSRSSPGMPTSANRGTCRVELTKRALPRPPRPPRAITTRACGCARSATRSSPSKTCVPTGTWISAASPSAPCLRAPRPFPPFAAAMLRRRRSEERSRSAALATRTTSPPSPPSPPSGPPFGTYFSRLKDSPPSPPRPAFTWICARSLNVALRRCRVDDRDRAAIAAAAELGDPVTDGEDRVVLADRGAGPGPELRAALADHDLAGAHGLAREDLHAEELRVRVAAVLRRPHAFLVRHLLLLQRCFQRRDRTLARRVRLLVRERRFDLFRAPRRGCVLDLRDRHLFVALRRGAAAVRPARPCRFLLRRRRALGRAERDLDPRRRGAVAVVPLVAGAPPVLADADLRPALVRDHRRRDLPLAEQHVGLERRAFLAADAVDDERLAVADAVLLVAEPDDRVGLCHGVETRA